MNKKDLARRMARALQLSQADAADSVDRLVCEIRKQTRKGKGATIPGLGHFVPGRELSFRDKKRVKRRAAR